MKKQMKKNKRSRPPFRGKNARRGGRPATARPAPSDLPEGVQDARSPSRRHAWETRMNGQDARDGGTRASRNREEITVEGVFHGNGRGFGFVTPDGAERGNGDIFIPAAHTGEALDGDRVRIHYHTYRRRDRESGEEVEKTEGTVVAVLERTRTHVIATLRGSTTERMGRRTRLLYLATPDNGRLPTLWLSSPGGAQEGDKISVRLTGVVTALGPQGEVTEVFGPADERGANYQAILSDLEVRTEFPPEVVREAEMRAALPLSPQGRTDRTGEVIFTIDGAGAKDLDDAVSLRRLPNGNWQLGVHIADVSEYVTPASLLEQEAFLRGTSIYFADKVVPMLPQALSNGACSLNAGEPKYALSAVMKLDAEGYILATCVTRSIIRSRVRGVYSEVNDIFAKGKESPFAKKYHAVLPTLEKMHALYEILLRNSRARGAMELDRPEAEIVLDAKGDPVDVVCRERGDAERMIEQFMLAANEGVATLMQSHGFPCVYRVHDKPEAKRLQDFRVYAYNLGLDIRPLAEEPLSPRAFSAVLDEAREKGLENAVSYTLLRTMAKAAYSEKSIGHFGLGIDLYCHFTSPIRRLSDLATHRMVKAVLLDGEHPGLYTPFARRAAEAASACELRALDAERQIDALYKTIYLSHRVGQTFPATVSSVAAFGMFAELENTCEGLLPLEEMLGEFRFDEAHLSLSDGRVVYRIGDRVTVRVEEADIAARRVRFSLVTPVPDSAAGDPCVAKTERKNTVPRRKIPAKADPCVAKSKKNGRRAGEKNKKA